MQGERPPSPATLAAILWRRVRPHPWVGLHRAIASAIRWALPGASLQPDEPVHPACALPVDEAEYAQADGSGQPPAASRGGLAGDLNQLGEQAERRPQGHGPRVEKLALDVVG